VFKQEAAAAGGSSSSAVEQQLQELVRAHLVRCKAVAALNPGGLDLVLLGVAWRL
jgi:hypothetical protein